MKCCCPLARIAQEEKRINSRSTYFLICIIYFIEVFLKLLLIKLGTTKNNQQTTNKLCASDPIVRLIRMRRDPGAQKTPFCVRQCAWQNNDGLTASAVHRDSPSLVSGRVR
jgi:hypothetical protein